MHRQDVDFLLLEIGLIKSILCIIALPYVLSLLILYNILQTIPIYCIFLSIVYFHVIDVIILYFYSEFIQENNINLTYLYLLPPAVLA